MTRCSAALAVARYLRGPTGWTIKRLRADTAATAERHIAGHQITAQPRRPNCPY